MDLTPLVVATIGVGGTVLGVLVKTVADVWRDTAANQSALRSLRHATYLFCSMVNDLAAWSVTNAAANFRGYERLTDVHRTELEALRTTARPLDGEVAIGLMHLRQGLENLDAAIADFLDPLDPDDPVKPDHAVSVIRHRAQVLDKLNLSMATYCYRRLPLRIRLHLRTSRLGKRVREEKATIPSMWTEKA